MSQALQFFADDEGGLTRAMGQLGMQSEIVREGFRYWESRRRGRTQPDRSDIDPLIDIPMLAPHIILFDVRLSPLDFRFRLVGSAVRHNLSRNYVGHWFSEYPNYNATGTIWPRHKLVAENLQPMLQRPNYVGPHNDFIYVENILLPLGTTQPGWRMQMMFIDFIRKKLRPSRPFT